MARWFVSKGRPGLQSGLPFFLFMFAAVLLLGAILLLLRPPSGAILPGPQPLKGSQPYATILCRFADPAPSTSADIKPASYYDQLMVGGPGSVDDFWRQVSYGAINLAGSRAFGWFQMAKPASAYNRPDLGHTDLDALARDCTAAADAAGGSDLYFPNYVGINLVFSECPDRPRGGAIDLKLDGRTRTYRVTWLCPGYASSQEIVAHEIGHSFGLAHSEDSQGLEYGNYWDLMSNAAVCAPVADLGTVAQQPIAYDKDLLGWIAPTDKYVVRRPGVVTIQLDYLEQQRGRSAGVLLAEIPLPKGRFYTVEARSRTGYDSGLPSDGVLIHEIDPHRENRAQLVAGQPVVGSDALVSSQGGWAAGSAFIDAANNVAISVDRQVDAGFVVTLYASAIPWPQTSPAQPVDASSGTLLQWQPVKGTRQYEVQVTRVSAATQAGAAPDWGATFVSNQPSLNAGLAPGRYQWQVRALPAGPWSPPQPVIAGKVPAWGASQQLAQFDSRLSVAPMVSVRPSGEVDAAWAQDDNQSHAVAVTRAVLHGGTWAVADAFNLPSWSQRGMALYFTPAGDLQAAWPTASVDGAYATSNPAVALDPDGRAHTIWAGAGLGTPGIFSAIVDAAGPSAGPVTAAGRSVRPTPVAPDTPGATKYSPALAVDGNGNAQAIWIDMRDGKTAVYSAEQKGGGTWSPGRRVSAAGEAAQGRPAIAMDSSGNAYAVWQSSVDCGGSSPLPQVSFAERRADGQWQQPVTIAMPGPDASIIDPVIAANESGEVYVAWGEVKDGAYRLYSTFRGVSGQWAPPRAAAEGHTDASVMTLSLAVSERGDGYLTWAETKAGSTVVRFAATR